MTAPARRDGLIFFGLGGILFLLVALAMAKAPTAKVVDFKAVYFAARCVLNGADPYDESAFLRVYRAEGGDDATDTANDRRVVTTYINLPTGLVVIAPFALLPFGAAHILWMVLIALLMLLAAYCIWTQTAETMPIASAVLLCVFLLTSIMLVDVGNSAGFVIPLIVLAACSFVRQRFTTMGVLAMALSLLVKPHDAGFIWLFFVLAGPPHRKRAVHALLLAVVLAVPGLIWISQVSPHWPAELHRNLAATQASGNINDPGPASVSANSADAIVDLQTFFSLLRDTPYFYNSASLLLGGVPIAVWAFLTWRLPHSEQTAWIALAAISCLTMLPLYHRQDDARLMLLCIPACAVLWRYSLKLGRIAFAGTVAAVLVNGDTPTLLRNHLAQPLLAAATGWGTKSIELTLVRPVPVVLLGLGCFFLWALFRFAWTQPRSTGAHFERTGKTPAADA